MTTDIRIMHMPMLTHPNGFRMLTTLQADTTNFSFKKTHDTEPLAKLPVTGMKVGVFHNGLFDVPHLRDNLVSIAPNLQSAMRKRSCKNSQADILLAEQKFKRCIGVSHAELVENKGDIVFDEERKLIDILMPGIALCDVMNGQLRTGVKTTLIIGEQKRNILSISNKKTGRLSHFDLLQTKQGMIPDGNVCPGTLRVTANDLSLMQKLDVRSGPKLSSRISSDLYGVL